MDDNVLCHFDMVLWVGLQCGIVAFPYNIHLFLVQMASCHQGGEDGSRSHQGGGMAAVAIREGEMAAIAIREGEMASVSIREREMAAVAIREGKWQP